VSRLRTHADIGLRWMKCGWRLFRRNPWLLGGMGMCCSAAVGILLFVPVIGAPVIGLFAPAVLAAFCLALDAVAKQKLQLPPALRFAALKQSPRQLVIVFRDEGRLMQALILGLYCVIVVVLATIVMWTVAGSAFVNRTDFSWAVIPRLIVAAIMGSSIYAVMTASLVYAVPLALLDREALAPAMSRSVKAAAQHAYALAVLFGFLLSPIVIGAIAGLFSTGLGYLLGLLAGAAVLPIVAAGLYCSYRTIFSAAEPRASAARIEARKVVAMPTRRH
jgi:hypothetical protein